MSKEFFKEFGKVFNLLQERSSYFDTYTNSKNFESCFGRYGLCPDGLDKLISDNAHRYYTNDIYDIAPYFEYLKWVNKNFNIKPTQKGINEAAYKDSATFLIYFLKKGWYPDQKAVKVLIKQNKLANLKLLAKYGILPDEDNLNLAVKLKKKKILKWCQKKDLIILPNKKCIS